MAEEEVEEEEVEEEAEEERVLCDSCEWYLLKGGRAKCKYVKEKDRIKMLESGIKCPEYLMAHRLQVS